MYDLGIIGGMGPMASIHILERILQLTIANCDQDHISSILLNNTKIPDRTTEILLERLPLNRLSKMHSRIANPKEQHEQICGVVPNSICEMLRTLEQIGVSLVIIDCNTAHYWLNQFKNTIQVPIIDMTMLARFYIQKRYPSRKGLVLGTLGTREGMVYSRASSPQVVPLEYPDEFTSSNIQSLIDDIKKGASLQTAARHLDSIALSYDNSNSCKYIKVLACTELSLLAPYLSDPSFVDAAEVLATATVLLLRDEIKEGASKCDVDTVKQMINDDFFKTECLI